MNLDDVDKLVKELLARAGGSMEVWILRRLLIADLRTDGGADPEPLVDKFLLEAVADRDKEDYRTEPFGTSTRLCLNQPGPPGPGPSLLAMASAPPPPPTAVPAVDFVTRVRIAMRIELTVPRCMESTALGRRVADNHFPPEERVAAENMVYLIAAQALSGTDPEFISHHSGAGLIVCLR